MEDRRNSSWMCRSTRMRVNIIHIIPLQHIIYMHLYIIEHLFFELEVVELTNILNLFIFSEPPFRNERVWGSWEDDELQSKEVNTVYWYQCRSGICNIQYEFHFAITSCIIKEMTNYNYYCIALLCLISNQGVSK